MARSRCHVLRCLQHVRPCATRSGLRFREGAAAWWVDEKGERSEDPDFMPCRAAHCARRVEWAEGEAETSGCYCTKIHVVC